MSAILALAILGWLVLLGLGGYLIFAAVAVGRVSLGFTGRIGVPEIPMFLIGLAVVIGALWLSPIHLTIHA